MFLLLYLRCAISLPYIQVFPHLFKLSEGRRMALWIECWLLSQRTWVLFNSSSMGFNTFFWLLCTPPSPESFLVAGASGSRTPLRSSLGSCKTYKFSTTQEVLPRFTGDGAFSSSLGVGVGSLSLAYPDPSPLLLSFQPAFRRPHLNP